MICRIDHSDSQYFDYLFPWDVLHSWIDRFRDMDIKNLYQIQRNETTRNADKFLNMIRNLFAYHLYILYGSFDPRIGNVDLIFGTWIYDSIYERRYASVSKHH